MRYFIKQAISLGVWHPLDVQFANMLVTTIFPKSTDNSNEIKKTVLMLASAYLSANIRMGHTCLPIHLLASNTLFQHDKLKLTCNKGMQKIETLTIDDWQTVLYSLPAVGNGSFASPLVLENNNLYLHRMWQDECTVAQFFTQSFNNFKDDQKEKTTNILNKLFSNTTTKINWHKIATTISLIHPRVLISGGPGTGKTSMISKIITALLLHNNHLRIQITATTGKATTIITYSCKDIIKNLKELDNQNQYKPILKAITIHSLLGSRLYKKKIDQHYSSNHLIKLDCLIIDEASMISLSILSKLISVLSHHTKVIFLGDHNQLHSIEPGSVFQDICQFAVFSYSIQQQYRLKELTGYILTNSNDVEIQHSYNNISDRICVLKQNYRFNKDSGIGQLAYAIKSGDYTQSLSILNSKKYTDIHYTQIIEKKDYISMITNCAQKYYKYLKILQNNQISVIRILQIFNKHRILCALQNGLFGVIKLNYYIEQILNNEGLIILNQSRNYTGKPIMILRNDPLLGLYNGDTGILLPNSQNILSAYFLTPKYEIKIVQIHQLPLHTTCFAMTVHKSQGSEFQDTSVVLPNEHLPILTRELIYTAITRTHKQLYLYSKNNILISSIQNITKRYSGLFDRIKNTHIHNSNTK